MAAVQEPPLELNVPDTEDAFTDMVQEYYHKNRPSVGWDRNPKVAGRPIALLKLYKLVMGLGGYDKLSSERMRWRTLVGHFGFGTQHEAAMTFQLKTTYYKYLAAFEISHHWHETPPPPEILEKQTAKGGDIRNRTLENYNPPHSRDSGDLGNGADSADDETQRTPKADPMDVDEPESGGRYPRRKPSRAMAPPPLPKPSQAMAPPPLPRSFLGNYSWMVPYGSAPNRPPLPSYSYTFMSNILPPTGHLRQDPRPTQMYQNDLSSSRMRDPHAAVSPQASPAPTQAYPNVSADPRNPAFSLDKYEARQPSNALSLRSVLTPAVNSDLYYQRKAAAKAQSMPREPVEPQKFLIHVVANGMSAPNIYLRCLNGLRSSIREEQSFALHHLVKVSYERGDKYKFEGFPLLAESLLEKALEISRLIYGIEWEVSYDVPSGTETFNTLNGAFGTKNLLQRLQSLRPQVEENEPETAEFSKDLEKLNETALIMRNMLQLDENVKFISGFRLFRDFLLIALNLPNQSRLTEFVGYALEMTEMVTKYWNLDSDDPLYLSLLNKILCEDRGTILGALQAIANIKLNLSSAFELKKVPLEIIERMSSLILMPDDPLAEASLNFLYHYTATSDNTKELLTIAPYLLSSLTPRLVTLLLHNATPVEEKVMVRAAQKAPPSNVPIAAIPHDLFMQLVQYSEPERSSRWLRCCFEEAREEDITQIAIWQAYQGRFQTHNPIPAADFIKNVSSTFTAAQAQVINGPQPRFIIRGIRPRRTLVGTNGESYFRCKWEVGRPEQHLQGQKFAGPLCNTWHATRKGLWLHMNTDHLSITRNDDGQMENASGNYTCRWNGCFRVASFPRASEVGHHIRSHANQSAQEIAKADNPAAKEAEFAKHIFFLTPTDEKGNPCGIPYMSVMLLRNLARYAMRNPAPIGPSAKERDNLAGQLFGHAMSELWHVMSVHRTLKEHIADLVIMIQDGESGKKASTE